MVTHKLIKHVRPRGMLSKPLPCFGKETPSLLIWINGAKSKPIIWVMFQGMDSLLLHTKRYCAGWQNTLLFRTCWNTKQELNYCPLKINVSEYVAILWPSTVNLQYFITINKGNTISGNSKFDFNWNPSNEKSVKQYHQIEKFEDNPCSIVQMTVNTKSKYLLLHWPTKKLCMLLARCVIWNALRALKHPTQNRWNLTKANSNLSIHLNNDNKKLAQI